MVGSFTTINRREKGKSWLVDLSGHFTDNNQFLALWASRFPCEGRAAAAPAHPPTQLENGASLCRYTTVVQRRGSYTNAMGIWGSDPTDNSKSVAFAVYSVLTLVINRIQEPYLVLLEPRAKCSGPLDLYYLQSH